MPLGGWYCSCSDRTVSSNGGRGHPCAAGSRPCRGRRGGASRSGQGVGIAANWWRGSGLGAEVGLSVDQFWRAFGGVLRGVVRDGGEQVSPAGAAYLQAGALQTDPGGPSDQLSGSPARPSASATRPSSHSTKLSRRLSGRLDLWPRILLK